MKVNVLMFPFKNLNTLKYNVIIAVIPRNSGKPLSGFVSELLHVYSHRLCTHFHLKETEQYKKTLLSLLFVKV